MHHPGDIDAARNCEQSYSRTIWIQIPTLISEENWSSSYHRHVLCISLVGSNKDSPKSRCSQWPKPGLPIRLGFMYPRLITTSNYYLVSRYGFGWFVRMLVTESCSATNVVWSGVRDVRDQRSHHKNRSTVIISMSLKVKVVKPISREKNQSQHLTVPIGVAWNARSTMNFERESCGHKRLTLHNCSEWLIARPLTNRSHF